MSVPASDERDAKLRALIHTMYERVPKEKRLTVEVVQQLLRAKYADAFPTEYLAQRTEFLTNLINSFYTASASAVNVAAGKNNTNKNGNDGDDDDDDGEEEEEDDDDEEDDDEGEEEDGADEGTSDEDEEDEEEDDSSSNSAEGPDGEPAEKRQRIEGDDEVAHRCRQMVDCLRRLSYRVRQQEEAESPVTYLQQCLVPLFHEKGLDPERYEKADVRRYLLQKELQQLQSDGADVSLDRAARAGRGVNHLSATKDSTINVKTSKFLDDE